MKLLILWQWGSLTRQIISCLDASSSVAVLPWHQITDPTLFHIHQALEGGHLLPQRGGDPGKEGATSDKLRVETAKTNISAQWCSLTGHRLLKLQKWYYWEAAHLSHTPSRNITYKFTELCIIKQWSHTKFHALEYSVTSIHTRVTEYFSVTKNLTQNWPL